MSDYTPSGVPVSYSLGTSSDIRSEFDLVATAIATKLEVNDALGTPASGTLTNCTGLPVATGISGLGTGVATALAVNVGSAGAPVVLNGALGTPSSGTGTNITGVPVATGISGLGTGVATALAVNVGSAGAPVVFDGALGTPSSGVATNLTGTAASLTAGGNVPLAGGTMTGALTIGVAGTPLVLNSTNSTGTKITFKDAGSATGNLYSSATYPLIVRNAADNTSLIYTDTSGNFTAAANVTAYSDERLKKNWAGLPADFIERLAEVKHGTYDRTDIEQRQVGVSAQSLQVLLPEAVMTDENDMLMVSYGNAALAACVALAEEVVRLRARLDAIEVK